MRADNRLYRRSDDENPGKLSNGNAPLPANRGKRAAFFLFLIIVTLYQKSVKILFPRLELSDKNPWLKPQNRQNAGLSRILSVVRFYTFIR